MKPLQKIIFVPWRWFKSRSWKMKLVVIVILLIIGFIIFKNLSGSNSPEYDLESARLESITEVVSETGNVVTTGAMPVYTTTTGMVDEVFVENGNYISEDQILLSVKSTATKQEQESALASYLTAKSQLETAEATQLSLQAQMFTQWDEFKELAEGDDYENEDGTPKYDQRGLPEFHVPEKEWLAAEANYKKQQQVIQQARVNMSAAWRAYQATQDSKVISLFAGEVKNLSVTLGSLVTAPTIATQASSQPILLVVDESIPPTIKIDLNENDVLKVKQGQTAIVEFDAIDSRTFEAVVDRVDAFSTSGSDVITFGVYLRILDDSEMIRSGMTADVDITVNSKDNVLTVPSSAIKPYQGGRAVRVVDQDGEIEFIPVETGAKGDSRTEIVSGIEEGTEVIVALENDQIKTSGGLF